LVEIVGDKSDNMAMLLGYDFMFCLIPERFFGGGCIRIEW